MWPLLALGAVVLGIGWLVSQASAAPAAAPRLPPAGPGTPSKPAPSQLSGASFLGPSGTVGDAAVIALGYVVLGTCDATGPCANAPTVAASQAAIANFNGLVMQRAGAIWNFQKAVDLPTTGCLDAVTLAALQAYLGRGGPTIKLPSGRPLPPCNCSGAAILPAAPTAGTTVPAPSGGGFTVIGSATALPAAPGQAPPPPGQAPGGMWIGSVYYPPAGG